MMSRSKIKLILCLVLGFNLITLIYIEYWKGRMTISSLVPNGQICMNSIFPPVLLNVNKDVTKHSVPNLNNSHIWQQVGHTHIWIYSAYYEESPCGGVIRLLVMKKRWLNQHLSCFIQFKDGASVCVSKGAILENVEAHPYPEKPYQGDFFICKVPNYSIPVSHVTISENCDCSDITNKVKVYDQRLENKIDFGVCVEGALHGNFSADLIIESIEFNRMMGAEKIIIYIESIHEHIMSILQYYQKQGIVEYVEWKTRKYLKGLDIFYYGQPLLINDCLYKMKHHTEFVTFVDVDEFLVPRGDLKTWKDLLHEYSKGNRHTAAWLAQNSFFIKPPNHSPKTPDPHLPGVLTHTYKSQEHFEPPIRSKYIARVDMVISAGVHLPHTLQSGYKYDKLPPDLAQMHHLKQGAEINTEHGFIEDLSAQKYATLLKRAVSNAKNNISKSNIDFPIL